MKRRKLICNHCFHQFPFRFWHRFNSILLFDKCFYSTCPKCKKTGWNTFAKETGWVNCYECALRRECETYDLREGCYMGEKEKKGV